MTCSVQLEDTLLDLEDRPADAELIDTAFRALHTLKGSGAMFGFDALAAFTHHVENAFDVLRKTKRAPTRALIEVALAAKDRMRVLIAHPGTAGAGEGDAILAELSRVMADSASGDDGAGSGSRARGGLAGAVPAAGGRDGNRHQSAAAAGRVGPARACVGGGADR